MARCKFYDNGNCKFGSSCRFEHINGGGGGGGGGSGVGGGGTGDPFASPPARGYRNSSSAAGGRRPSVQRDRPRWPFTAVGAHPVSSGNVSSDDLSQEELRVLAYQQSPQTRGCSAEVVAREAALVAEVLAKTASQGSGAVGNGAGSGAGDPFASSAPLQRPAREPLFAGLGATQAQPPPATNGFMGAGATEFAAAGGAGFNMAGQQAPMAPMAGMGVSGMGAPGMTALPSMTTTPPPAIAPPANGPVFAFQK